MLLVKTANDKIYDYNMDSMLRLGFFRILSPVLQVTTYPTATTTSATTDQDLRAITTC